MSARRGGGARTAARSPDARASRKAARIGVAQQRGFVYFLDSDGDVARAALGATRLGVARKVLRLRLARDPAYLYFIDSDGDVARVKRAIP